MAELFNVGYSGNPVYTAGVDDNGFYYGTMPMPFRAILLSAGQSYDTGISVDAGWAGRTILVIASEHWSDGNNTGSGIYMVRCGYNGSNYSVVTIANSHRDPVFFSVNSSGNLVLTADIGATHVFILMNK